MQQYICRKTCFNVRLWSPGETTSAEWAKTHSHFAPVTAKPEDAKGAENDLAPQEMTEKEIVKFAKERYGARLNVKDHKDALLSKLAEIQRTVDPEGERLAENAQISHATKKNAPFER